MKFIWVVMVEKYVKDGEDYLVFANVSMEAYLKISDAIDFIKSRIEKEYLVEKEFYVYEDIKNKIKYTLKNIHFNEAIKK